MTLAVALARTGVLQRHGLNCQTCTPELKVKRGCGAPPKVTTFTFEGVKTEDFTDDWLVKQAEAAGVDPSPEFAQGFYAIANLGRITSILGEYWDCCPRYYDTFAPLQDKRLALDAWEAANDLELGIGLGDDWQDLTPEGRRILRTAVEAFRWHQHDLNEKHLDSIKGNMNNNTGRGWR